MRNAPIAALANFFLPGVGYLLAGTEQLLAIAWLVGAVGLTYVEFGIREPEPRLYAVMFASVFVMNAAFAVDVFRTVRSQQAAPQVA